MKLKDSIKKVISDIDYFFFDICYYLYFPIYEWYAKCIYRMHLLSRKIGD